MSNWRGFVAIKKTALDAAWAENLPAALGKGLRALESCFGAIQADAAAQKDPNVISCAGRRNEDLRGYLSDGQGYRCASGRYRPWHQSRR